MLLKIIVGFSSYRVDYVILSILPNHDSKILIMITRVVALWVIFSNLQIFSGLKPFKMKPLEKQ